MHSFCFQVDIELKHHQVKRTQTTKRTCNVSFILSHGVVKLHAKCPWLRHGDATCLCQMLMEFLPASRVIYPFPDGFPHFISS